MPLIAGTRLGSYEVVGPLGAGGMGEVYRARDTRLGREVAIKVLPAEVASHPDRLARFEREARTVAGLNHPNIVVLHSVEDVGGTRFLTMELVEGQSLDHQGTPGGLPVARVVELGIALADALSAAHEKGIVHRDLKPANVMLTREGRVKVLDFGLAKLAENSSSADYTQAATMTTPLSGVGQVLGTVPYMAPEQIRGETADARTDIFALGVVLYELASGKRPFAGATSADVTSAILRDMPAHLAPVDLDRIVTRCLEKNPRERYQSALDVMNDLRALRRALDQGTSGAQQKTAPEATASIAVLPFVNRSANADDEYFSDGLADELLNALAKIKGLRVTARSSAFHFKGKDTRVSEVGQALDVATVLEGSVRKAGNRVRISVQLVSVANGSPLWSESYDRTLDDIFAVQDDITQSVVKELRATLLGEEADSEASGRAKADVAKAAKGRAADPEAHRLYLQARHLLERLNRQDTVRAIEYLDQALKIDPEFALAWATLGGAYATESGRGWGPKVEGLARARQSIQRALELEPDLAEAYVELGWLQTTYDWNFRDAAVSLAHALELAPGSTTALRRAGVLVGNLGRAEEAIGLYRRAAEQDPLSASAHSNLGSIFLELGRLEEAELALRKALELAPQRINSRANLALVLLAQSKNEEAIAEAQREPHEAFRPWSLAIIHHALGHDAEAELALHELLALGPEAAFQIAEVYGARGEIDTAFEWLERALVERDPGLVEMKISVHLRSLHGDPRWQPLVKKMGLDG